MTITTSSLQSDFNQIIKYGEQVRVKYYNLAYTGEYDDDVTLNQSGVDTWISGLVQPLDTGTGGYDGLLLQQGKITLDDKKMYVIGTVATSGMAPIKVGITGSPPTREYQILQDGQVIQWNVNGSPVYKKLYLRYLPNGSFVGE